jgi:hypothetical protein
VGHLNAGVKFESRLNHNRIKGWPASLILSKRKPSIPVGLELLFVLHLQVPGQQSQEKWRHSSVHSSSEMHEALAMDRHWRVLSASGVLSAGCWVFSA